eukprot:15437274-Alexandrium_andersonii.AAC.1
MADRSSTNVGVWMPNASASASNSGSHAAFQMRGLAAPPHSYAAVQVPGGPIAVALHLAVLVHWRDCAEKPGRKTPATPYPAQPLP